MKIPPFATKLFVFSLLQLTQHYMFRPRNRPSSGAIQQYYKSQVTQHYMFRPICRPSSSAIRQYYRSQVTQHYMFRPICRPSSGAIRQYYKSQVTEFFLRGSNEARYSITAVVCYIAKIHKIYLGYIRCSRYLINK
jgi:hypothetical protein